MLALCVPVLTGLAAMAIMGAPAGYIATNAAALALALALLLVLAAPPAGKPARIAALALLAVLFLPLLTGPETVEVRRWLPLGPFVLHAGMVAVPPLVVLAARDPDYAAPIMLAGLLAALLQPDAASAFAVTIAAVGLHHATRDWKQGLTAIVGFVAMIVATLRGELPAQPFVERVLVDAAMFSGWLALALFIALVAGFVLLATVVPLERPARLALAGSLFGFSVMALMNNYPSALIGYGAAPIIGYGLALGLVRSPAR